MKTSKTKFLGASRLWWIVLIIGIGAMLCGFAYWLWPAIGFAVSSQIFGWLMVLSGIVALCVSIGKDRPKGWGWWLVCGIIDIFVGFMLVRNLMLSEKVFPYFISLVFASWGLAAIFSAIRQHTRSYWWLYLINGILLIVISGLLINAGCTEDMLMTSVLTAISFIYWGFSLSMLSYGLRPAIDDEN